MTGPDEQAPGEADACQDEMEVAPGSHVAVRRMVVGLAVGLIVAVAVVLLLGPKVGSDLASATSATRSASQPAWLVGAFIVVLIALAADAGTVILLVRRLGVCTSVLGTAGAALESHLVAGATSFGGLEIPYLIMRLHSLGVSVSSSTSVIMVKGMVHVSVLAVVAAVALLPVGAIGITPLQRWILVGVVGFLVALWLVVTVWLKWPVGMGRVPESVRSRLRSFREAARVLRSAGWRLGLPVIALQVVYWVAIFSLIPMILMALGWRGGLVPIVVGQAVLQVLMPLSPLPGGAGVAELGYLGLIGRTVPRDLTVTSLVIWRTLTWVLPMTIGALILTVRTYRRGRRIVGAGL